MSNEYRLTTIKDILEKVPADRIEDCMKELTLLLTTAANMAELIRAVGSEAVGRELPALYTFPDEIVWRDDGAGIVQANFPCGDATLAVKLERGRIGGTE